MDRNGSKLATSERVYNVILDVKAMLDDEDYLAPTKQALRDCFGIEEAVVDALWPRTRTAGTAC